ncbi:MAG: glycosyltransferase [Candidatus Methylomirabilales bacterium]
MPAVSVIIPTYNRKALLLEALTSVFAQTYRDYEVIVVDDESTDGTREALMPFGERIRYISPAPSAAIARNRGIHQSRAPYVAFLDSDDLWEPDFLAVTMRYLKENPHVALVCTACRMIPGGRKEPRIRKRVVAGNLFPFLLRQSFINTSAVVAKRECLEKVGCFDENLPTAEDYDMWLRLTSAFPVAFLNVALARRRKHAESLSGNRVLLKESALRAVESLYHRTKIPRSVYQRLRSDLYISMGRAYMKLGDHQRGKACFRQAVALTPYRLRPRRYLWFAFLTGRGDESESVRTE